MKGKIFLSHKSDDKRLVDVIAHLLSSFGLSSWFDLYDISPGYPIRGSIIKGLKESDQLILFATNDSLKSKWVVEEVSSFITNKGADNVLVVRLEKLTKLPDQLKQLKDAPSLNLKNDLDLYTFICCISYFVDIKLEPEMLLPRSKHLALEGLLLKYSKELQKMPQMSKKQKKLYGLKDKNTETAYEIAVKFQSLFAQKKLTSQSLSKFFTSDQLDTLESNRLIGNLLPYQSEKPGKISWYISPRGFSYCLAKDRHVELPKMFILIDLFESSIGAALWEGLVAFSPVCDDFVNFRPQGYRKTKPPGSIIVVPYEEKNRKKIGDVDTVFLVDQITNVISNREIRWLPIRDMRICSDPQLDKFDEDFVLLGDYQVQRRSGYELGTLLFRKAIDLGIWNCLPTMRWCLLSAKEFVDTLLKLSKEALCDINQYLEMVKFPPSFTNDFAKLEKNSPFGKLQSFHILDFLSFFGALDFSSEIFQSIPVYMTTPRTEMTKQIIQLLIENRIRDYE